MKRLNTKLNEIKERGCPGFMMHTVAGFPDMESSEVIAQKILDSGADILEIQIPFSDPVADGPIIASANELALARGATVAGSLEMIKRIASANDNPILIMTYFNIIHRYGVEAFCEMAKEIGVQGLIVPDYPLDEDKGNSLILHCEKQNLALVQVVASTTREDRLEKIAEAASGFVYCMARTGTTGKKTNISQKTTDYLVNVRKNVAIPLAVGFGLSDSSQVEMLEAYADIMVVGSALINEYAEKSLIEGLQAIQVFMERLTN